MRKLFFIAAVLVASVVKGQTTLDQRIALAQDAAFVIKLKMAMQQVAIGILTTPLSQNPDSVAVQVLKKNFAKGIVLGGGDSYVFPVIASGAVSAASTDNQLYGVITQMFGYFAAFRQEQ